MTSPRQATGGRRDGGSTAPGHGPGAWHCRADHQVAVRATAGRPNTESHLPTMWPQVALRQIEDAIFNLTWTGVSTIGSSGVFRVLAGELRAAAKRMPVVTLTGPRQSGKTSSPARHFQPRVCVAGRSGRAFAGRDGSARVSVPLHARVGHPRRGATLARPAVVPARNGRCRRTPRPVRPDRLAESVAHARGFSDAGRANRTSALAAAFAFRAARPAAACSCRSPSCAQGRLSVPAAHCGDDLGRFLSTHP